MALTPAEQNRHAAELARAKRARQQEHADRMKMRTGGRPENIVGSGGHPNWHDKAIRSVLSDAGYNVARDGGYTARAHAAWDHYLQQKRAGVDPRKAAKTWNNTKIGQQYTGNQPVGGGPKYGGPYKSGPVTSPKYGHGKQPKGDIRAGGGGGGGGPAGGGGGGHGGNGGVDLSGLQNIATKVGVMHPNSLADALAGLQYDAPIHDARQALDDQHSQDGQDMRNIGDWYDQVMASQKTAGARDHAASAGAVDSVKNAVTSIIQSLGGGANGGMAEVGAAGADKVGLLSALGLNQDQYNDDLAPILRAQGAGAKQRQLALNSQADQKAQSSLTDLLGQRGQNVAKNLLDIQQQNAQTQQQRFQNKLALEQANEAALMAGLNVVQANQKIKAGNIANAAAKKAAKGGWLALDNPARENYITHALSQAVTLHSEGGHTDWGAVGNTAREILRRSYGYGSARAIGYKGRVPSGQAQVSINSFLNKAIQTAQAKQPHA